MKIFCYLFKRKKKQLKKKCFMCSVTVKSGTVQILEANYKPGLLALDERPPRL